MKERPILFSGPMVRAILDGRKTQTRRVMKIQPRHGVFGNGRVIDENYFVLDFKGKTIPLTEQCKYRWLDACPYGKPGDRLWVRETWQDMNGLMNYGPGEGMIYKADHPDGYHNPNFAIERWKPSIHMRREYSRIDLEITGVRVERLQDISQDAAKAEGVDPLVRSVNDTDPPTIDDYRGGFHLLWDIINGKKHPWASNPWVWVIEFKKLDA